MAHRAIDLTGVHRSSQEGTRATPTVGLRGGLGKTLLIAFLLLAIVPLSLLAFFTYHQIQQDTGSKLMASLETMVALEGEHLVDWVAGYERDLALLAGSPDLKTRAGTAQPGSTMPNPSRQELAEALSTHLAGVRATDPGLIGLILADRNTGELLATAGTVEMDLQALQSLVADDRRLVIAPAAGEGSPPLLAVNQVGDGWRLIGLLDWDSLRQIVAGSGSADGGIATCLVTEDGLMISERGLTSLPLEGTGTLPEGFSRALQGQNGSGVYTNLEGVSVFGAYRWNPDLQIALVAEQAQTQVLEAGNTLTAVVVGATLAVALITAAIAAVVTRRLTVPIVQLTETAAWMARGDLNQEVTVNRQDEIGVLARAFNRMAAELRVLYSQLEAKVAERTRQLEEAHERTRYYVMQLTLSAEVARVASSIRDVDALLATVAQLIGNAFELHYVSIYLLDEVADSAGDQRAVWRAGSRELPPFPEDEVVGGPTLVGQVAADGQRRVLRRAEQLEGEAGAVMALQPPVECEMGVPLHSQRQVLGVLDLQSSRPDDFDANDEMVYQTLANQVGIAIENARAYTLERKTVEKLRELDRIQAQFLTNMSHALRTPLNTIIGFSRIILKGLDGPLTDLQRDDLDAVYQSGRQLLGLINDMLELSHLDLGTASFSLGEVDLAEIVEGVMATARALAGGKPVQLYEEVPADLPVLYTDGQRVRQVILALLSNAIKFTDEGSVRLRVVRENGRVTISVSDTGMGIPQVELARLFSDARYEEGMAEDDVPAFGLAISRRVVERLGGQIWVKSEEGIGSTFTFTLPIKPIMQEPLRQDDSRVDAG